LKKAEETLSGLHAGSPLVQIAVEPDIISEVISGWTGIPTGRMLRDEIDTVLNMQALLGERIIGQDHALTSIAQMIQTAHAGIEDPPSPRRSSCSSARAGSARPRPPWPSPSFSTAGRKT